MYPTVKKSLRILKYFLLSLVVLLVLLVAVINLPFAHSIITRQVNSILKSNGLPIVVNKISLSIAGDIELSKIEMIESNHDTIMCAGNIKVSFKVLPLFSKQIIVNEIRIENAAFNLVSDDSGKLNLLSYFPTTSDTTVKNSNSATPWEISLAEAHLQNIKFRYSNPAKGIIIQQSLNNAEISFDEFSMIQKKIEINILKLDSASGFASISTQVTDTIPADTIPSPWKFSAKSIELNNIVYNYTDPVSKIYVSATLKQATISLKTLDLSSGEVYIPELKIEDPQLNFTPSDLKTEIAQSNQTKEIYPKGLPWTIICDLINIKNGKFSIDENKNSQADNSNEWFPAQKLNAVIKNAYFKPQGMGCLMSEMSVSLNNKLFLQSGKLNVRADSSLNGKISIDLLATTGKEINMPFSSNDTVVISAVLSGSMNILNIERFSAVAYCGIKLDVSGSIKDLTQLPDSRCELKFHTNSISQLQAKELISIFNKSTDIPAFKPVLISGTIGNTFFNPDFNLNISSSSGQISAIGNYNINSGYGKVDAMLNDIKLNEISGNNDLHDLTGKISWNGKAKGINDISGDGEIEINDLTYKDITTRDLNLDFKIEHQLLLFNLSGIDTTLTCALEGDFGWEYNSSHGHLAGTFEFNEGKSDLLPGYYSVKSKMSGSFSKSPGVLKSSIKLSELTLTKDNHTSGLDSISLNLNIGDSLVSSSLSGDFINADFITHSSLSEFTTVLSKIEFENILALDSTHYFNGSNIQKLPAFNLNATAQYDSLFTIFFPDTVFRFHKADLMISKTNEEQIIHADLEIDSVRYQHTRSYGAKIALLADPKKINGDLTIDSMKINDVWSGLTKLKLEILPEKITGSAFIADSSGAPIYQLGAEALKGKETVVIRTTGPDWIINSNKWNISPPEFLNWEPATNDFVAQLNLQYGDMIIRMDGRKSDSLKLEMQNIVINRLFSGKLISSMPDGIVNANVTYSDKENTNLEFIVDVKDLKWKGVWVDHVGANGFYKIDELGAIDSKMMAQLNDSSSLNLKIVKKDILSQQQVTANFNYIPVQFLEPFTQEYINKLGGTASGEIILSDENTKPNIDGKLKLNAVTLNIIPLQAWFSVPQDSVLIKSNQVKFDHFVIFDSLKKQLFVDGTINLENTDKIIADLSVSLEDIRVMNTTVKDNPDFFGSIIVNSGLKITGAVTQPSIKGKINLQEGTNITYRHSEDLSVQERQKTVTFASLSIDTSAISSALSRVNELSGLPLIQTTLEITPKSIFNFEISSSYNINIGISGTGLLNYAMLPNNSMSLTGSYEITQGTADLKFTGWPVKKFTITKGSLVRWDGDVSDPEVNLEATSKVKGSYVNPVDNKTRYVDFIVSMKLTNQVSKLKVAFDVKSPDQYISSVLNTLPEDELMRQAVNLLIFESINLPNIESSSNYVSSQINSFWESQLNSLTKTSIKSVDLSFGVDSYTQTSASGGAEEKTSVTYQMEKKLFKNRASVKVSGRFNDDSQAGNTTNNMVENFIFEYQLDTMERKFAKLYTRKDYEDILDGEVTKSGVGFIYRKSYPDFRSIWTRKAKKTRITEKSSFKKE